MKDQAPRIEDSVVFTDEHPNNRMNTDHEKDLEKLQCF